MLNKIGTGELAIPAIQRGFAWERDTIIQFLDSLIEGYPFGALYIAEFKGEFRAKVPEYAKTLFPKANFENANQFIIDGQQRLIAVKIAIAEEKIDNYRESTGFFYYQKGKNGKVINRDKRASGQKIQKICDVLKPSEIEVPVIYYKDATQTKIFKIFGSINATNTPFSGWDLFVAKLLAYREKEESTKQIINELAKLERTYSSVIEKIGPRTYQTLKTDLVLDSNGNLDALLSAHPDRIKKKLRRLASILGIYQTIFREYKLSEADFGSSTKVGATLCHYINEMLSNWKNQDLGKESIKNISYLCFLKIFATEHGITDEQKLLSLTRDQLAAIISAYGGLQRNKAYSNPLTRLMHSYFVTLNFPDPLPDDDGDEQLLGDLDDLELEHIFPQKPIKLLGKIDKTIYLPNIDRIGNYTFLSKRTNGRFTANSPTQKMALIHSEWHDAPASRRKIINAHFCGEQVAAEFQKPAQSFLNAIEKREKALLAELAAYLFSKKKNTSMNKDNK